MNRVMLLGHLLEDPRTRTAGQYQVTSLWIETREDYKDRNKETKTKTQKHTVEMWGSRSVLDQIRQGSLVLVEGSLETSSYDKNGEKRWKTVVKATNIRCLGQQPSRQEEEPSTKWGEEPPDDSDLPF